MTGRSIPQQHADKVVSATFSVLGKHCKVMKLNPCLQWERLSFFFPFSLDPCFRKRSKSLERHRKQYDFSINFPLPFFLQHNRLRKISVVVGARFAKPECIKRYERQLPGLGKIKTPHGSKIRCDKYISTLFQRFILRSSPWDQRARRWISKKHQSIQWCSF